MNVKQLITQLQQFNPDAEVKIALGDDMGNNEVDNYRDLPIRIVHDHWAPGCEVAIECVE